MDDVNYKRVCSKIADAFEQVKYLQDGQSELMNQVAALRDVLKEASPRFAEAFQQRLEYWKNRGAALRAQTNAALDGIIDELRKR